MERQRWKLNGEVESLKRSDVFDHETLRKRAEETAEWTLMRADSKVLVRVCSRAHLRRGEACAVLLVEPRLNGRGYNSATHAQSYSVMSPPHWARIISRSLGANGHLRHTFHSIHFAELASVAQCLRVISPPGKSCC